MSRFSLTAAALAAVVLLQTAAQAAPANLLLAPGRTEPTVAVDPAHPGRVVVVTNTNYDAPVNGAYPNSSFASFNGGRTFSSNLLPVLPPYTTEADPIAATDRHGTVFLSYLAEPPDYCNSDYARSVVILAHSIDGGQTWRGAHIVNAGAANDKPNLAVRSEASGPSQVFLTWTRFLVNSNRSQVWFARSLDGGVTFAAPTLLYTSAGFNTGTMPIAASNRRIYVMWNNFGDRPETQDEPAQFIMRTSADNGAHFGPARVIERFRQEALEENPGALRNLTQAQAVADPAGRLILTWPRVTYAARRRQVDIVVARSVDGGKHWSTPYRVNSSTSGDRFMPAIDALPDGSAVVLFYDRRRSPNLIDVLATRVGFAGGAHRSANVRVNRSDAPVADITYIPPSATCFIPGRFFGDYIGIAGRRSPLAAAWTDTQSRTAGETDVWFARVPVPALPSARSRG